MYLMLAAASANISELTCHAESVAAFPVAFQLHSTYPRTKVEYNRSRIARFTHRGERLEGAVGNLQDLLLAEFSHVEERRVETLELRLGDDSGPCGGERGKCLAHLKLISKRSNLTRLPVLLMTSKSTLG